jgi:hypothetical protein
MSSVSKWVSVYVIVADHRQLSAAVTFKLESVPSSTRDFEFTTNVGSTSPFVLSATSSTRAFYNVDDAEYHVTLPTSQTAGYTVAVVCSGASTYSTSSETTTFTVAGDHVACTFTLTGMLTVKRDSVVSYSLSRR